MTAAGTLQGSHFAYGEDKPVRNYLYTKEHEQGAKEEVWHVLNHADRQRKQQEFRPCSSKLAFSGLHPFVLSLKSIGSECYSHYVQQIDDRSYSHQC